jgi:hypothetical protein
MRAVSAPKGSTHACTVAFLFITMKICPVAQRAQVTMATYQQHHSHKLEQRSYNWLHTETEAIAQRRNLSQGHVTLLLISHCHCCTSSAPSPKST